MADLLYGGIITAEQHKNLVKLKNCLKRLEPTHRELFYEGTYIVPLGGMTHHEVYDAVKNATRWRPHKVSCCSVLYGPSCGIPLLPIDYRGKDYVWDNYSYRVFLDPGPHSYDKYASEEKHQMWEFLFSCGWATGHGQYEKRSFDAMREAIARLEIFTTGRCPDRWSWSFDDRFHKTTGKADD